MVWGEITILMLRKLSRTTQTSNPLCLDTLPPLLFQGLPRYILIKYSTNSAQDLQRSNSFSSLRSLEKKKSSKMFRTIPIHHSFAKPSLVVDTRHMQGFISSKSIQNSVHRPYRFVLVSNPIHSSQLTLLPVIENVACSERTRGKHRSGQRTKCVGVFTKKAPSKSNTSALCLLPQAYLQSCFYLFSHGLATCSRRS